MENLMQISENKAMVLFRKLQDFGRLDHLGTIIDFLPICMTLLFAVWLCFGQMGIVQE